MFPTSSDDFLSC